MAAEEYYVVTNNGGVVERLPPVYDPLNAMDQGKNWHVSYTDQALPSFTVTVYSSGGDILASGDPGEWLETDLGRSIRERAASAGIVNENNDDADIAPPWAP